MKILETVSMFHRSWRMEK